MTLDRRSPVGSTFSLSVDSAPWISRRSAPASYREFFAGRVRVLVVDDDPQVLGAHVRALRSQCVAVAATSAAEALQMLHQSRFDVLLTDHDMPGSNVATLLEEASRMAPDMRRIVISGAEERVLAEAVRNGLAHEYLCKPVSAKMLHEVVAPV